MRAAEILQRCVASLLIGIHRRRLAVLLEAVAATVRRPRLTLSEIGRRFASGSDLRHRSKRVDRLLLAGVAEPLIVIN